MAAWGRMRKGAATHHRAWMIPGMYPKMVNKMLIKKSAPHLRT